MCRTKLSKDMLEQRMYPSNVWCKLSCIVDKQTCVFENACGNRKLFLRSFKRKQSQSMYRHAKHNGSASRHDSWIPYPELISLARIYLREGFPCYYCGRTMSIGIPNAPDTCSIDHRKPICNGGENSIANIVLCCEECNMRKGECDYYR
jgi:hypothetical protein